MHSSALAVRLLLTTLSLAAVACGSSAPPPTTAPAAPEASSAPEEGAATSADPYASFDGGAASSSGNPSDFTNVTTPAPAAPSGDLGAACQKAAAAWEKRARPQIKACYREGKKKDPNLMGTARINVDVGFDGKLKPAKLEGVSSLGDDVAKCMVAAVSATAFPESGECKSRQLTVPVEFPTPVAPH